MTDSSCVRVTRLEPLGALTGERVNEEPWLGGDLEQERTIPRSGGGALLHNLEGPVEVLIARRVGAHRSSVGEAEEMLSSNGYALGEMRRGSAPATFTTNIDSTTRTGLRMWCRSSRLSVSSGSGQASPSVHSNVMLYLRSRSACRAQGARDYVSLSITGDERNEEAGSTSPRAKGTTLALTALISFLSTVLCVIHLSLRARVPDPKVISYLEVDTLEAALLVAIQVHAQRIVVDCEIARRTRRKEDRQTQGNNACRHCAEIDSH